jgi:hypothetical protein
MAFLWLESAFNIGFISVVAIRMHPSKCASVRSALVLDLQFYIKLGRFPQR